MAGNKKMMSKMMASEKGETKKSEKKEKPKLEKMEKMMGSEKPMPFKRGGKVKGK